MNKMRILKLSLLVVVATIFGCDDGKRDVPTELFGVRLGATYKIGEGLANDFGELPIKKMVGVEKSFTVGTHLYFEPLVESKAFQYKEKRASSNDAYFTTTHRLYLLPIIPKGLKKIEELESLKIDRYEVTLIEWSDYKNNERDAYYWVVDICKTFTADMRVKAETSDNLASSFYSCTFKKSDRLLEIYNIGNLVLFKLGVENKVLEKKIADIDTTVRQLKAKDILK